MENIVKPFDKHPGFYELDNRKNRPELVINRETLEQKHEALLKGDLVKGKSVLDLGSCLGATGQRCLFYGATEYIGVEVQKEYAIKSKKLLKHFGKRANIINDSIENFLSQNTKKFDIVVIFGVLYTFLDYHGFLKKITSICNNIIVIDTIWPNGHILNKLKPTVEISQQQAINLANKNASLTGLGTKITPSGLKIVMNTLGFDSKELVIYPKKIISTRDSYNIDLSTYGRYLARYFRTNNYKQNLSEDLKLYLDGKTEDGKTVEWESFESFEKKQKTKVNSWKFDEKVAEKFKDIAIKEIPNYLTVIKKCLEIAGKTLPKDAKIIDVGSAIGGTIEYFSRAGFENIYGVEQSIDMINNSFNKEKIIHSETFPKNIGTFDMVMANWTLHFIFNRESYINDIYEMMNKGGIFILTEKVTSSQLTHEMYINFKRKNGISEQDIRAKTESLKGVLATYPIEWYFSVLKSAGFEHIDIIDSNYSFITFMMIK